ncbi:MAG: hypothetical protein ABIQ18_37800 [Umezawaea sp.]
MNIRVTGTPAEIDAFVDLLRAVVDVREVSDFYPNRGRSSLGRVYLDITAPTADTVQVVRAKATRIDRKTQVDRTRSTCELET